MQSEASEDQQLKIKVDVETQQLHLLEFGQTTRSYTISTSGFGLGPWENSNKTPLGRFEIAECLGGGMADRTIFRSRKPVGDWDPEKSASDPNLADADLVLGRILWLSGSESHNANTKDRYIYIHGTNHEDQLGQPVSHGCVRMSCADVVELFDRVTVGTPVEIG